MSQQHSHTNTASMDAETLEALKGSIAKWEGIVAGTMEDYGVDNCPLCQRFWIRNDSCRGCPVQQATGLEGCHGTPYMNGSPKEELDFLKSLLPSAQTDEERS